MVGKRIPGVDKLHMLAALHTLLGGPHSQEVVGHSLEVEAVGPAGAAASWCEGLVRGCCATANQPMTLPEHQWLALLLHCVHAHSLGLHGKHMLTLVTALWGCTCTSRQPLKFT